MSGGTINTAAGTGTVCSKSGDGGAATAATLCNPVGLATDTSGDLFIVDQGNNVIREVNSGGIISKIAGTGAYGATGDGGSATAATLGQPSAAAVNGSGDLFIADTGNNVVRRSVRWNDHAGGRELHGRFVGRWRSSHCGTAEPTDRIGVRLERQPLHRRRRQHPHPQGRGRRHLHVRRHDLWELGDGGPATSAQLKNPYSIAIDSLDNLYINDYDIGNIRKVTTGGTISEVAAVLARQVAIGPGDRIITSSDFTQQISLVTTGGVFPLAGTGAQGFSGDGGLATGCPAVLPVERRGRLGWEHLHRRLPQPENPAGPGIHSSDGTSVCQRDARRLHRQSQMVCAGLRRRFAHHLVCGESLRWRHVAGPFRRASFGGDCRWAESRHELHIHRHCPDSVGNGASVSTVERDRSTRGRPGWDQDKCR